MSETTSHPDLWSALRRYTGARIALGRAGGSLPTAEVLDFAIAHAAARDAVEAALDVDALESQLGPLGEPHLLLATLAPDRETYLKRPDLGRRLDRPSREVLEALAAKAEGRADVVLVLADGLSSQAVERQSVPLLKKLLPLLRSSGLRVAPLCIVCQARVAVEDEIGLTLGARAAVILIGERPGLGTADSLGAYLVFDPQPGRTDAQRNCVSNIREGGLDPAAAAAILHYLITESLRRQLSGVGLRDDRPTLAPPQSKLLTDSA